MIAPIDKGLPSRILSVSIAPLCCGSAPAARAFDFKDGSKLVVQHDFLYNNNRITGSRRSGSFLTPGNHVTDNLSALYNTKKETPPGKERWTAGRLTTNESR